MRNIIVQKLDLVNLVFLQTHVICFFVFDPVEHKSEGENNRETKDVDQVSEYCHEAVLWAACSLVLLSYQFSEAGQLRLVLKIEHVRLLFLLV